MRYTRRVRVLGIDCGSEHTGYGVVEQDHKGTLLYVTAGAIHVSPRQPLALRLHRIFSELCRIIGEHRPDTAAI